MIGWLVFAAYVLVGLVVGVAFARTTPPDAYGEGPTPMEAVAALACGLVLWPVIVLFLLLGMLGELLLTGVDRR